MLRGPIASRFVFAVWLAGFACVGSAWSVEVFKNGDVTASIVSGASSAVQITGARDKDKLIALIETLEAQRMQRINSLDSSQSASAARLKKLPTCGFFDRQNECVGSLTLPNGDEYVGEVKFKRPHGFGALKFKRREGKYVGFFVDGIYEGDGVLSEFGHQYRGAFKAGQFHGLGDLVFPNGVRHCGTFNNGHYEGQGVEYTLDGSVFMEGNWHDDRLLQPVDVEREVATQRQNKKDDEGAGKVDDNQQQQWLNQIALAKELKVQTEKLEKEKIERDKAKEELIAKEKALQLQTEAVLTQANQKVLLAEAQLKIEVELANQRRQTEESQRRLAEQRQRDLEDQLRLAQQQNPAAAIPPQSTKRIALVVGNAAYKTHPLKNPRNDADDMSQTLKGANFTVIDLRDATLSQMRYAVRQFGDKLLENDIGLVYYSGHGVEVKGRNYFIPVNADIEREDEIADQGLDVSLILEKMTTAGKGVNILVVDACRDDPFGRSFRSASKGLVTMDAPRGTIIAYSTSPGRVASDGEGRNSPYTRALVKAMQTPNRPIEQVFKEVRRAVQEETKNQQTPWENTSLSGDFYFRVQN